MPLIYPIPNEEQWVETNLPPITSSNLKLPDISKKNIKKSVDEKRKYGEARLRHKSLMCSNCMQYNYNYRTCSPHINPNEGIPIIW